MDTIGTVSQGVVSYNIKISLDTQEDEVKPGMSVTASIITGAKTDVLLVPNTAIKSDANGSYVSVLPNASPSAASSQQSSSSSNLGVTSNVAPQKVYVQTGDANDTDTEITSGLSEGDQIIVRTVTMATVAPVSSTASKGGSASILTGGGGGRGGAASVPR